MARIRTIKPEFPQSESIGRLSRDARLLFIQLWTIVDDAGRTRAASRMLASLLYPYDDDAPKLIEGWLGELEREQCIRRYEADGAQYLDIPKWLEHQKIDKPSKSRMPEYREGSPKPREPSRALATDLGPGPGPRTSTLDLGPSEANASDARASLTGMAALDARTKLFQDSLARLASITGKTPDSCRSLVGRWLKSVNDEAIHVVGAIEDAERNRVVDPVAWINRVLQERITKNGRPKPTVHEAAATLAERLLELDQPSPSDLRGGSGQGPFRLLPTR